MKLIFLDIDGCLNRQHFGKDEQSRFGFDDKCVNGLRYILTCCPDAKIVISSVWKKFEKEPRVSKEVPWINVLEKKLGIDGVVIGKTPDMEGTTAVRHFGNCTRADEILEYLGSCPKPESYVVIDDEISCYKGTMLEDHVIDCEIKTGRGLDAVNACMAVRILKGIIGSNVADVNQEMIPNICYQSLFDDARNMADTLRKIDAELAMAAQCKGDCPGGYPLERLLPNLCEIMYSCIGGYNNERYN